MESPAQWPHPSLHDPSPGLTAPPPPTEAVLLTWHPHLTTQLTNVESQPHDQCHTCNSSSGTSPAAGKELCGQKQTGSQ